MNNPLSRPSYFCAAMFALAVLSAARSEQTTSEIKLSDASKPATLKISLARGDLRIQGADTHSITVNSEARGVTAAPRKDGLRVLTASSSFKLSEKENVITLDASDGWGGGSASIFNITVPYSTTVIVSNSWGGDIFCADLTGDIDIKSMHGEIKLDGIASGVLVETMNGEITANVRELHDGKPLSFTSMNGEIVIRVPTEAKANVRLRSQNGSILTDFDEKALVTKTESIGKARRAGGRSSPPKNPEWSSRSEMGEEIHAAVKEAVQAGIEVAREAAEVAREAAQAAREALKEAAAESREASDLPPPNRPPLPPMTGGKIVSGTLNGGGPEVHAATMNGDVTLRKLEVKK